MEPFMVMGALSVGKALFSGIFGGAAADRQIAQQYRQIEQNNLNVKATNETIVEQNKAIQEYNKKVMLSAAETVGQINLQRTYETKKLSATLFNIQSQSAYQQKQATASYAATDTIGATVKDAASSVNIGNDRLASNAKMEFEQVQEGLNMTLKKAMDDHTSSMKEGLRGVDAMVTPNLGSGSSIAGTLLNTGFAALDVAAGYYADTYSFSKGTSRSQVMNNVPSQPSWYSPKPTYKQNFGSRYSFFD